MSDTLIQVPNYPLDNLVPGFYFSIDPSNANSGSQPQKTLIVGQILGAGTYTPNVPVLTYGTSDVIAGAGGANAMLAREVARYLIKDDDAEVWVLPLADAAGSVATVMSVQIAGPASGPGQISLMVAGIDVQTGVSTGDTVETMATNMAAAINAIANMPCTAVVGASPYLVSLTADNKGLAAGDLDVRANYYGTAGGEQYPAGVSLTIAQVTAGSGNPVTGLTAAIANLGAAPFDFYVNPYTDTASLNLFDTLLDLVVGRWSWAQQLYGGVFSAIRGTVGSRQTFAAGRNDRFISYMGYYDGPNPAYEWAADYAASSAASLRVNPAIPLGGAGDGVNLSVLPPPIASRDIFSEQSTLLTLGISTYLVEAGGQVRVQRAVNSYTVNGDGEPDNSFRDVETNYTLMACIRDLLQQLSSQFGRKILVVDGTPITGGSAMVTSQTVLQACISRYRYQSQQGLAQNPALFASNAKAQNAGNGTVLLYLPYQVANQLRVVAGSVSFSKP